MPEIVLIGTRHGSKGVCNAEELYRILERINPDVVFEEIPPSLHSAYHVDMTRENLESNVVNAYLQKHSIQNVPVDYEPIPPDSFFEEHKRMHQTIEKISYAYCRLIDEHIDRTTYHGFKYLNSDVHDDLQEKLAMAVDDAIKYLKDESFLSFDMRWREIIDLREETMLNNIYAYCEKKAFGKGLFLIGSAHRRSIMRKVSNREGRISWNFKNYANIL